MLYTGLLLIFSVALVAGAPLTDSRWLHSGDGNRIAVPESRLELDKTAEAGQHVVASASKPRYPPNLASLALRGELSEELRTWLNRHATYNSNLKIRLETEDPGAMALSGELKRSLVTRNQAELELELTLEPSRTPHRPKPPTAERHFWMTSALDAVDQILGDVLF